MDVRPIRTESDYLWALEQIHKLFEAEPGTPDGDRLDVLVTLVEGYEVENYPVPPPDAISAIEYHMESHGLTRKDLEPFIGSRARVSEILNRRRPLTLRMIRKLSAGLGISTGILAQEYQLRVASQVMGETTIGEFSDQLDEVVQTITA